MLARLLGKHLWVFFVLGTSGLLIFVLYGRAPNPGLLPSLEEAVAWQQMEASRDLKPDNHSRLIRSREGKTPVSVVFIHGFSASPKELSPVVEQFAEGLQANVYLSRLKGHGGDPEELGNVKLSDWLNDAKRALRWGRHLGDRVVLIGNSTGAPLALWLAASFPDKVFALYLLSPNFGPKDRAGRLLTLPGGALLAEWVEGTHREWKPKVEKQRDYWHTRYPSRALVPMMQAVSLARESVLRKINTPVYTAYSKKDEVLDVGAIKSHFLTLGSKVKELHEIESAQGHMLGGMASPNSNEELLRSMLSFYNKNLVASPVAETDQ